MIRTFLLALLIFAAVPIFAQDQTDGFSGGYTLNGAEDDLAITHLTITGTGPIYVVGSEDSRATKPLLAEGAVAVWAAGQHELRAAPVFWCTDATARSLGCGSIKMSAQRRSAWNITIPSPKRPTSPAHTILSAAILTAHSIAARSLSPGTDQGSYTLRWAFTSDQEHPADVPFSETGIGTTRRNILGYTFGDEGVKCSAAVAEFNDSGFDASFVGADGHVVGFTGAGQP